ncbi:STAS domain-containing protein [Oceanospirillum sediminis]|uniref:STAS domain-containing protein n=1 Tax=Oceanospirillum sediminis TaxID=2760088 RepID=A0A839IMH0_9GAMM|nr:STAS domain-containing protein [Oceanospirillum sediminis]
MSLVKAITPDRLQVSGVLDFNTVAEVRRQGEILIQSGPEAIEIDFSGVSRSGSPAVSVMMCWLRTARASDKQIRYTGVPDILQNIIDVSGLRELLSLDYKSSNP